MDSRAITVNAEEVLRTLPQNKAFHFFEDINEYTGKSASNLVEFCEMAKTVNKNSITFHFERHDFERWTKETLHDPTLARRISKLKKSQSEGELSEEKARTLIYQITKNRLAELKKGFLISDTMRT